MGQGRREEEEEEGEEEEEEEGAAIEEGMVRRETVDLTKATMKLRLMRGRRKMKKSCWFCEVRKKKK